MALRLLIATLFLTVTVFGQIDLDPPIPVRGQTFRIKISNLEQIFPSDRVFVVLYTFHAGLSKRSWAPAQWNGTSFEAEMVVPHGCSRADIWIHTLEKQIKRYKRFVPTDLDGKPPMGTHIDSDEWKFELEKYPKAWWMYLEAWRRQQALGQIRLQELTEALSEMEKEEPTAELLRTVAFGYWMLGDVENAIKTVRLLCMSFPGSPYSVASINDAHYQLTKHGLFERHTDLHSILGKMFNFAPTNPGIRDERNATSYLTKSPVVELKAVREMFDTWTKVCQSPRLFPHVLTKLMAPL